MLRDIRYRASDLKRGKPVYGWIGFTVEGLPHWPITTFVTGQHSESLFGDDGEYLGEEWVDDTTTELTTQGLESVSLSVTDPFEEPHPAKPRTLPFHDANRKILGPMWQASKTQ